MYVCGVTIYVCVQSYNVCMYVCRVTMYVCVQSYNVCMYVSRVTMYVCVLLTLHSGAPVAVMSPPSSDFDGLS